jgi:hypothetical protein
MKRAVRTVVAAVVLTLTLVAPAQARQSRTVYWVCDVPGEGLVTFVTAAEAARHGIDTANDHAGQTFYDRFGEVCTVE